MSANVIAKKKKIPNISKKFALCYNEVNLSKSMRSIRYVPNTCSELTEEAHTYSVKDSIITIT